VPLSIQKVGHLVDTGTYWHPKRYRLTYNKRLLELINIRGIDRFRETYRKWVDFAIAQGDIKRQPQWTASIAVGDKVYVEKVKDQMGYKAIGRKVVENGNSFLLREPQVSYQSISDRAVRLQPEDNTI
jgi:hypothetical protein